MEKLLEFVRERKKILFLSVVALICLAYIFFAKVLKLSEISFVSMAFIIALSALVYILISLYLEYLSSKRKLSWVNSIYDDFVHMQIFLDNNDVVIEVLEGEAEKLEQLAYAREFKTQRVFNKNDLVKILIK
ncbi:MAG: hypothetical protein E7311_04115 [Clostridiales bacterium]|nr:hypothetical protein [Clostridiales bacterium]